MDKIINKSYRETKNVPEYLVAFIISVTIYILDPKSERIQINENAIKPLLKRYLVSLPNSFANLYNISKHYK